MTVMLIAQVTRRATYGPSDRCAHDSAGVFDSWVQDFTRRPGPPRGSVCREMEDSKRAPVAGLARWPSTWRSIVRRVRATATNCPTRQACSEPLQRPFTYLDASPSRFMFVLLVPATPTAAAVPAFIGFAVGRTTFWGPLVALRDGKLTREAAVADLARRYRRWAEVFQQAAKGSRRTRVFDVRGVACDRRALQLHGWAT